MFGYDKKELLEFITNKIGDWSVDDIQNQDLPNVIGQGSYRTAFYYSEYPDIVFKIGIGQDVILSQEDFEIELSNYNYACENKVDQYFAKIESIGTIELLYENYIWSEELQEDIYKKTISYEVYIQPKIDYTMYDAWVELEEEELTNELTIIKNEYQDYEGVASNTETSALFIKKYGLDEYHRLSDFIQNTVNLSDLHDNNWALMDNNMIIIDYSL